MKIFINNQEIEFDIADTFLKKLFGLMGKKNIKKGMLFKNTNSIHTFFMKENIDVIMFDKNKRIIYIKKNVGKRKIIIQRLAYYVLELPNNTLSDKSNITFE